MLSLDSEEFSILNWMFRSSDVEFGVLRLLYVEFDV